MKKLLLLHGAIGSASQFDHLSASLRDTFKIYTCNFSGHGGREIPHDPFSIKLFAEETVELICRENFQGIDVFGYSMGGYVALYIAKNYPGTIGKIFTLATKFKWTEELAEKEAKMLNPERIAEKIPSFAETLHERHSPSDWKTVLEKTADMMQSMGKANPLQTEDYGSIEQLVRIAIGDRDKMVSFEETLEVYNTLKDAQMLVMPDTPHPFEQVSVERLSRELKDFFR